MGDIIMLDTFFFKNAVYNLLTGQSMKVKEEERRENVTHLEFLGLDYTYVSWIIDLVWLK